MKKIILAMLILLGLASFSITTNVQAAVDSNSMGSPNITIDGNFDDWKDKPITDIKEPWDNYNIKHESLLADQDNIYFFLDMSPEHGYGYATIQPSGYELTVGDKKFSLSILNNPYDLEVNKPKKVGLYIYEHDNIGNVNKEATKAEAYAVKVPINVDKGVGQGYTGKLEFKLPLSELGITGTTAQEITMKNTNLGTQTLHVKGGSTGPIVLAVSGFAIALLAVIKMPKINELRKSLHE
ncbi:Firmicu-CTERM sorting domain-containing protein [Companilactobacillus heilongjiangensis]|uniref:Firmicu-CTERM sorting domain-containing protein n=1 Tax=Companilactobacillus heilongjiangensis TaxID=1074467 RepID=UPI00066152FB|nr:Firmicu-CTERM sorting domain-containing protein [Companilactobacillus heilongjiangensis]